MGIIEILLTSIGVAMDAFAVSICKGVSIKKFKLRKGIIIGLYFGIFQGAMPLIGFLLGKTFEDIITSVDHWAAFILLGLIGANMIKEALSNEKEEVDDKIDFKTMLPLAIATSIDALAVGITFAFLKVNIVLAVLSIGITTFIFCVIGSKIGNVFGSKYEKKAELVGGIILILLGTRILLEHLAII